MSGTKTQTERNLALSKIGIDSIKSVIASVRSIVGSEKSKEIVSRLLDSREPMYLRAHSNVHFLAIERVVRITLAFVRDRNSIALTDKQAQKLIDEGLGSLQALQAHMYPDAYAKMNADLLQAAGTWFKMAGNQIQASWKHELAFVAQQLSPSARATADQHEIRAQRFLRQGYGRNALQEINSALGVEDGQPPFRRSLVKLHILRLTGNWDEAEHCARALIARLNDIPEELRLELEWEKILLEVFRNRSARPAVVAVKRGGSHAQNSVYWLEAFYIDKIFPDLDKNFTLPSAMTKYRTEPKFISGNKGFFKAALDLDELIRRAPEGIAPLGRFSDLEATLNELLSIDKELLVIAAYIKGLEFGISRSIGEVLHARYRAKSLTLSDGKSDDIFAAFSLKK